MNHAHGGLPPTRTAAAIGTPTFEVVAEHADGSRATVRFGGEMDLATTDLVSAVLDNQLASGHQFVCVDLSRVGFLDCAALRALVDAHNRFLAARGALVLTGVSAPVARLLRLTGLAEALFVVDEPQPVHQRAHLRAVPER